MTSNTKSAIIQPGKDGSFSLPFPKGNIAAIHFADIDLLINTKDGKHYVLPGAALSSMEELPPKVIFEDMSVSADKLLSSVEAVDDPSLNTHIMGSSDEKFEQQDDNKEDLQKQIDELKKLLEETQKKAQNHEELQQKVQEQNQKIEEDKEQIEAQDQKMNETAAAQSHKEAQEQVQEQLQKIVEQLHMKDYDYTPPREFTPPPAPFGGPAGVPAPISMTPLVLLTMGNAVGTDTSGANIYGGGGDLSSGASAKLGPRDALQFSTAVITGTAGNDVIYAEGPIVGNTNPALDTSMYAKEFLLRVAGYFTELNDITIKGLPSYVSVDGGTLQADGSWTLPSSYVVAQQAFQLIYDKDAWRPTSADTFDMTVEVSGEMRNTAFTSSESFRFRFMDVTDASQVTNPNLTYWDDGQNKQVYILQTQDQPNTITADAGDDIIYGSRNHDTIDAGSGNDIVFAYGGNNVVTGGTGNDQITTGDGNDTINSGDGDDTIVAGAGTNVVQTGDGTNSVTTGSGNDTITGGSGVDTINAGDGDNSLSAGAGDNIITTGAGDDVITVTDGNNTITAGDGDNIITAGNGNNTIVTGSGIDQVTLGTGTNSVLSGSGDDSLYGGAGDDTLNGEDGNDLLRGGLGINSLVGGAGTNTADYTGLGVAVTASLLTNTAAGAGVSDTYTQIQNITGSDNNDTITGDASVNILSGGAGDDSITGSGGNDIMYGNDGNDSIVGNVGNDTVYGGAGNDTVNGGGGGADFLYGGDGDDSFVNPSMNTFYDGGAGTDKVDYSSQAANLIIDLSAGTGYTGAAQMATYTSIEWIVGGTGSDTLTGGASNDTLDGGAGTDYLRGGTGSNTLIGGTGTNYYYMGIGADAIVADVVGWNQVEYYGSPAGVVVNLDSVNHSFVNSLGATITVNALSGSSRGETAADTASWSIGDTYTAGGVDYLYTGNYNDVLWGSSANEQFMAQGGNDTVFAYDGNDTLYMSAGNDLLDGGAGTDVFYSGWSSSNMIIYLDGTADVNLNGTADYLEKGASILGGSGYTGFANGWSGTTLLTGIENIVAGGGSDFVVGDAGANQINPLNGNNLVYGLGGDDLFHVQLGSNTIDGGSGTDAVSFSNVNQSLTTTTAGGYSYSSGISAEVYLTDTDLDNDGAMDRAATWGSYTGFTARTNSSGVYSYSTITNVENIVGSVNADKLAGDASANIIRGYSGNDYISGNGGADSLYGDDGNDTLVVSSAHIAAATLIAGGNGTDTLRSSGWTFAAGSIYASDAKFTNIESVDVRNSVAGGACTVNAYDIRSMVDAGNASVLQLNVDSGDTVTCNIGGGTGAVSFTNPTHTATDDVFRFYSDVGNTVLVATLNVHYGA